MTGKSESDPMMIPTKGRRSEKPDPGGGEVGAYRTMSSGELEGRDRRRGRNRALSSASESATTVICPIFRPLRHSDFPYKWMEAPGTESATLVVVVISSMDEEWPMRLSIATEGTLSAVDPSGSDKMARR
jgi:hypothetical protein